MTHTHSSGPATHGRLLVDAAGSAHAEQTSLLLARPGCRIERIVSSGQASPDGFWYDQPDDEWVLVVAGNARLAIENGDEIALAPGDYAFLPARCRHRVSWTDPTRPTVWLAIHLPRGDADATETSPDARP